MGNIDDQHRNTNMNDKDHLVGQLTNHLVVKFWNNTSGTTYNWPNLEPMQVALYLAGEITQVKESIPWVRCASGNVFFLIQKYKGSWNFKENISFVKPRQNKSYNNVFFGSVGKSLRCISIMQESACLQDRWTAEPLPWQQLEKFDSSGINERSSTKWDNCKMSRIYPWKKNWQVRVKYLKSFFWLNCFSLKLNLLSRIPINFEFYICNIWAIIFAFGKTRRLSLKVLQGRLLRASGIL